MGVMVVMARRNFTIIDFMLLKGFDSRRTSEEGGLLLGMRQGEIYSLKTSNNCTAPRKLFSLQLIFYFSCKNNKNKETQPDSYVRVSLNYHTKVNFPYLPNTFLFTFQKLVKNSKSHQ